MEQRHQESEGVLKCERAEPHERFLLVKAVQLPEAKIEHQDDECRNSDVNQYPTGR